MRDATDRYVRRLTGGKVPVRTAAATLADGMSPAFALRERRHAAARAVAAASIWLPAALARHATRRGGDVAAAWDVAQKFGRPSDLEEPAIGVRAQLDRVRLDPRLGGLLGDAADPLARWLAAGGRVDPAALGRAVAAVAPLVLGALLEVGESPAGLASVAEGLSFPPAALQAPQALHEAGGGRAVRVLRRVDRAARGGGVLARILGR